MKKMIMLLAVLMLLGGGGAAAYFYLFANKAEAALTDGAAPEHEAKSDEAEKAHHEYVELDPLILPIVDNEGVSQVVSLVIALEVKDAVTAEEVRAMAPKLKDAFIQDMYGVLNKQAALKGGVIQVSQIKERLNVISNQIMGGEKINDVLLQVVQQRPI